MDLESQIRSLWNRTNCRVFLVEGIPVSDYTNLLSSLSLDTAARGGGLALDFLDLLGQDLYKVVQRIENVNFLLVYNMDLFGDKIDPDQATNMMKVMRYVWSVKGNARQLLIARPNADFYFSRTRAEDPSMYNHPMGNWCVFCKVESGTLIDQAGPVEHKS